MLVVSAVALYDALLLLPNLERLIFLGGCTSSHSAPRRKRDGARLRALPAGRFSLELLELSYCGKFDDKAHSTYQDFISWLSVFKSIGTLTLHSLKFKLPEDNVDPSSGLTPLLPAIPHALRIDSLKITDSRKNFEFYLRFLRQAGAVENLRGVNINCDGNEWLDIASIGGLLQDIKPRNVRDLSCSISREDIDNRIGQSRKNLLASTS